MAQDCHSSQSDLSRLNPCLHFAEAVNFPFYFLGSQKTYDSFSNSPSPSLSLTPSFFLFQQLCYFLSFLLHHLSIYLSLAGFGERLWRDGESQSEDVPAINLLLCSVTMGLQHQHPYPA